VAPVKGQRQYSSPLRERQAQTTRRAVLDAARELFVNQGYGATTIEQIAASAGVSKATVFTAVGNKQTLLRTIRDVAIAGDDEPVPVAKRPLADRVRAEPDPHKAVRLLAQHLTAVAGRYAVINEVIHTAANSGEDELRELWETEEEQRLVGARIWIGLLTEKGPLPQGLDVNSAVDTLWLLMAPDHYHRLVHRRGWTRAKYQRWLVASIGRWLLPGRP